VDMHVVVVFKISDKSDKFLPSCDTLLCVLLYRGHSVY
jgi:hypothetical protein